MKKELEGKRNKKNLPIEKEKFLERKYLFLLGNCLQEVSRSFVEEYVGT
jgi:hypothetical protein